jgi:hypothetical protein
MEQLKRELDSDPAVRHLNLFPCRHVLRMHAAPCTEVLHALTRSPLPPVGAAPEAEVHERHHDLDGSLQGWRHRSAPAPTHQGTLTALRGLQSLQPYREAVLPSQRQRQRLGSSSSSSGPPCPAGERHTLGRRRLPHRLPLLWCTAGRAAAAAALQALQPCNARESFLPLRIHQPTSLALACSSPPLDFLHLPRVQLVLDFPTDLDPGPSLKPPSGPSRPSPRSTMPARGCTPAGPGAAQPHLFWVTLEGPLCFTLTRIGHFTPCRSRCCSTAQTASGRLRCMLPCRTTKTRSAPC